MSKTLAVPGIVVGKAKPNKIREKDTENVAFQKKPREALANITNNKITANIPKDANPKVKIEKSKSFKTSKVVKKSDTSKKADPMVIDEEERQEWVDIDAEDRDDAQALAEYVNEIYEHLFEKEKKDRVAPNYLSNQPDINEKMRGILVDWLVEVHRMFKLIPETLFLCVNIIDRYLSMKNVTRDKLQLVGITAMLIASKYEEIYAPESNDFVYISDGAFTKDQILTMEQTILNALQFNLLHPSPLHFLRRFSKAAGSDYTIHTLCKYLIELTMLDVEMLKWTSSQLAAGAVYVARMMTEKSPAWSPNLAHYTTLDEEQVYPVALEINELLKKYQKNANLKAIKKKYASPKFGQVSELPAVDF